MNYIIAITSHVDVPECKHIPALEGMQEFSYPVKNGRFLRANENYQMQHKRYKTIYTECFLTQAMNWQTCQLSNAICRKAVRKYGLQ